MPKPVLPPTPPKRDNPLLDIRSAVATGNYRLTSHVEKRMAERNVILSEVLQILDHGWCEPRKDEFKREKGGWNYAIRGKTPRQARTAGLCGV